MAKSATSKKSKAKTKTKTKTKLSTRSRSKMPKRKKTKAKAKTKAKTKKPKSTKAIASKRASISKPAMIAKTTDVIRVQAGDQAPDFTLPNHNGEAVTLSSYRGKNVVLYFYPKDDTPGCTKEACSFRDNIGLFDSANTVILGVSFDDQASHQKFIEKYGLNFQLLSDPEKKVAQSYGVYVQKNMYGNISWGIERSTFVINPDGIITKAIRKVNVDGHTDEVLEAIRSAN